MFTEDLENYKEKLKKEKWLSEFSEKDRRGKKTAIILLIQKLWEEFLKVIDNDELSKSDDLFGFFNVFNEKNQNNWLKNFEGQIIKNQDDQYNLEIIRSFCKGSKDVTPIVSVLESIVLKRNIPGDVRKAIGYIKVAIEKRLGQIQRENNRPVFKFSKRLSKKKKRSGSETRRLSNEKRKVQYREDVDSSNKSDSDDNLIEIVTFNFDVSNPNQALSKVLKGKNGYSDDGVDDEQVSGIVVLDSEDDSQEDNKVLRDSGSDDSEFDDFFDDLADNGDEEKNSTRDSEDEGSSETLNEVNKVGEELIIKITKNEDDKEKKALEEKLKIRDKANKKLLNKVNQLKKEKEALGNKNKELSEKFENLRKKKAELEKAQETFKTEIEEKEKQYQDEIAGIENQHQEKLNSLEERLGKTNSDQESVKLKEAIEKLKKQYQKDLESKKNQYEKKLEEKNKELEKSKETIKNLEAVRKELDEKKTKTENYEKIRKELEEKFKAAQKGLGEKETELEKSKETIKKLKQENSANKEFFEKDLDKRRDTRNKTDVINQKLNDLQSDLEKKNKEIEKLKEANSSLRKTNESLENLKSELLKMQKEQKDRDKKIEELQKELGATKEEHGQESDKAKAMKERLGELEAEKKDQDDQVKKKEKALEKLQEIVKEKEEEIEKLGEEVKEKKKLEETLKYQKEIAQKRKAYDEAKKEFEEKFENIKKLVLKKANDIKEQIILIQKQSETLIQQDDDLSIKKEDLRKFNNDLGALKKELDKAVLVLSDTDNEGKLEEIKLVFPEIDKKTLEGLLTVVSEARENYNQTIKKDSNQKNGISFVEISKNEVIKLRKSITDYVSLQTRDPEIGLLTEAYKFWKTRNESLLKINRMLKALKYQEEIAQKRKAYDDAKQNFENKFENIKKSVRDQVTSIENQLDPLQKQSVTLIQQDDDLFIVDQDLKKFQTDLKEFKNKLDGIKLDEYKKTSETNKGVLEGLLKKVSEAREAYNEIVKNGSKDQENDTAFDEISDKEHQKLQSKIDVYSQQFEELTKQHTHFSDEYKSLSELSEKFSGTLSDMQDYSADQRICLRLRAILGGVLKDIPQSIFKEKNKQLGGKVADVPVHEVVEKLIQNVDGIIFKKLYEDSLVDSNDKQIDDEESKQDKNGNIKRDQFDKKDTKLENFRIQWVLRAPFETLKLTQVLDSSVVIIDSKYRMLVLKSLLGFYDYLERVAHHLKTFKQEQLEKDIQAAKEKIREYLKSQKDSLDGLETSQSNQSNWKNENILTLKEKIEITSYQVLDGLNKIIKNDKLRLLRKFYKSNALQEPSIIFIAQENLLNFSRMTLGVEIKEKIASEYSNISQGEVDQYLGDLIAYSQLCLSYLEREKLKILKKEISRKEVAVDDEKHKENALLARKKTLENLGRKIKALDKSLKKFEADDFPKDMSDFNSEAKLELLEEQRQLVELQKAFEFRKKSESPFSETKQEKTEDNEINNLQAVIKDCLKKQLVVRKDMNNPKSELRQKYREFQIENVLELFDDEESQNFLEQYKQFVQTVNGNNDGSLSKSFNTLQEEILKETSDIDSLTKAFSAFDEELKEMDRESFYKMKIQEDDSVKSSFDKNKSEIKNSAKANRKVVLFWKRLKNSTEKEKQEAKSDIRGLLFTKGNHE